MRNVDRPEPPQQLGKLVKTAPAEPAPTLRQVPNARPGVVSDSRTGTFQTVPTSEVRK